MKVNKSEISNLLERGLISDATKKYLIEQGILEEEKENVDENPKDDFIKFLMDRGIIEQIDGSDDDECEENCVSDDDLCDALDAITAGAYRALCFMPHGAKEEDESYILGVLLCFREALMML